METDRVNRKTAVVPEIGEIVLVIGEEKNKGEWRKAKVVRHIRGKDGDLIGVALLHKGHHIERPLQLVCALELRGPLEIEEKPTATNFGASANETRKQRRAA